MDLDQDKCEVHLLLGPNSLRLFKKVPSLEKLYQALKTSSLFVTYHPEEEGRPEHIHLINEMKENLFTQRFGVIHDKVKRKVKVHDNFQQSLHDSCARVPRENAKRQHWVKNIVSMPGTKTNCFDPVNKAPSICHLAKAILKSEKDPNDNHDCLGFLPPKNLVDAGLKEDDVKMLLEGAVNDTEDNHPTSSDYASILEESKDKPLSKDKRWNLMNALIDRNDCRSVLTLQRCLTMDHFR